MEEEVDVQLLIVCITTFPIKLVGDSMLNWNLADVDTQILLIVQYFN